MAESDYTANYIAAAQAGTLDVNVYADIEGITEMFSIKPVVGLANNVSGLLVAPVFSGAEVDIDSPKTPFRSVTFTLIDTNNQVSEAFQEKDLHEKTVKLYTAPNATLNVSDYGLKAEYRLKEIRSIDGNTFTIKCIETGELLNQRLILGTTVLLADIDASQTNGITLNDVSEFTGSGTRKAYIDKERISFTAILAGNELDGVTRGVDGTSADSHEEGDDFKIYRSLIGVNIIDMMLQLIISSGGGGTYDVLDFGLGISEALVDVAEFERIRDSTGYLSTASSDLEIKGDEESLLVFFEKVILEASAVRLWYRDNGQISILVLAEPVPDSDRGSMVQADMQNGLMPIYHANSRRIVNILKIKINYDITDDKFKRELVFEDANSIAKYGKKKIKTISARSQQTGNNALAFMTSFSNKYFTFYSTPAPQLDRAVLLSPQQYFDNGNVIDITHPDLPNFTTGERGVVNDKVQIIGKFFDFSDSTTSYNLFYARNLNLRSGFIAPTGTVKAGSWSTTVFELITADDEKFEVGDKVTLWNKTYDSPPVNFSASEITAVNGDEITVSPAFSTIPLEGYRLRYDTFDVVQDSQKVYAFIGKTNGDDFTDGTPPYKIGA